MCTYQAANMYYYKYSINGVNIILLNSLVFVVVSIMGHFVQPVHDALGSGVLFVISMISVIPLANLIGLCITSIAVRLRVLCLPDVFVR